MKSNRIVKEKIKKIYFKKYELKKKLLKSLKNNKNIDLNKNVYASWKLNKLFRKKIKVEKSICLVSGRQRGIWRFCSLSRHQLNSKLKDGNLINCKSSSW